jgi:hypothetical protein
MKNMLTVAELEKTISGLRTQAAQLNTTADSLELILVPLRQQEQIMRTFTESAQAFAGLFNFPTK